MPLQYFRPPDKINYPMKGFEQVNSSNYRFTKILVAKSSHIFKNFIWCSTQTIFPKIKPLNIYSFLQSPILPNKPFPQAKLFDPLPKQKNFQNLHPQKKKDTSAAALVYPFFNAEV